MDSDHTEQGSARKAQRVPASHASCVVGQRRERLFLHRVGDMPRPRRRTLSASTPWCQRPIKLNCMKKLNRITKSWDITSCRAATTAGFYIVYLVNLWRFWSHTWHRVSPCFTSRVDRCASALRTGAFGWGLGAVIKASETTKDKKQRHQKDTRKTRVNQSNGSNNNLARESRAFHLQGCLHLLNIPSCSAPSALRQLNLDKQIYRLNCRVTPVTPDPNERSRQGTRTTRTTNTALHSAASA